MITDYLSKIDGEILKVEPIFNYLKELEETNPKINFQIQTETSFKIEVESNNQIVEIKIKYLCPGNSLMVIKIFEENYLMEEISLSSLIYNQEKQTVINHTQLAGDNKLFDRRYVYNSNGLISSKERVVEVSMNEIEEVIQNKFNRFNDIEKDYLFEKYDYSRENVLNHLRKELSFLEIINMVETKRNVKTKYANIEEKPHILLKKYS